MRTHTHTCEADYVLRARRPDAAEHDSPSPPPRPAPGRPWKIGWYGAIRCQRSLDILSDLAALDQQLSALKSQLMNLRAKLTNDTP